MALFEAKTKYGLVRGHSMEGYTVFKGIPYAKPPLGEGRFAAPQEPDSWEGIYEAEHFGSVAMQVPLDPASFYGKEFYQYPDYMPARSEDCLYLNIWTPAGEAGEKLPVAFWIHGGAFLQGYSHEVEFDGEAYCRRGVVLVSINYRLGVFGFLAHPWLEEEQAGQGGRRISGNYALLDQIAALRWVRENIAAFGGDPGNITVFGQSAGCMSVQALVSTPLTEDWIAKAIFQSASGYKSMMGTHTMEEAKKAGEEFVQLTGAADLEELRAIPAGELLEMQKAFLERRQGMGLCFGPTIDHYILDGDCDTLLERGEMKDIPYMMGSTAQDLGTTPQMRETGERGGLYYGCVGLSHKLEELGRRPGYVYYFTRSPLGDDAGAFHSSELWYMFGTLERSWRPKEEGDYALSGRMLDAWTEFMKCGDPEGGKEGAWRPCTKEDPYVQILDI